MCSSVAGGYGADTASLAMDYRLVGFRECAAEVSRYLVSIEGMDLQDPLRLRLISHLQCYSAQREASAKACGGASSLPLAGVAGGPPTAAPPPPPPPHPWSQHHQYATPSTPAAPVVMPMHNPGQHPAAFDQPNAGAGSSYLEALGRGPASQQSQRVDGFTSNMRLTSSMGGVNPSQLSVNSPPTGSSSQLMPSPQPTAAAASLFGVHHAAQFLGAAAAAGMNSMPMLSPNGLHYGSSAAAAAMLGQGVKPYRPWGAELAY